ncbi:hypothetical protein KOR42_37080 [Thalassoglobus neptunius]|uniref:UPF0301 protein KOR42_37080 n=1 Tax=Thalassoglobus neptunius TaxID=1938619 RepID=A0A5C5WGV2_9PLAN|nr:YqgE/AlgH family protein [Thalassoglobus neptunius]TWT50024.1 hypothetical protein KOR42_37080 [Thalassoglobus neptunius]
MTESLRGKFLVSGPRLRDENFFKSVVLIVEHGEEGAMGLVINHPSSVTVAHALQEHLDLPETQDLVYVGGPVEPAALFVVHNSPALDPTESPVIPDVFMGSSAEVFERILTVSMEPEHELVYRVYGGCSGWGPGQLEGELERGDWLTIDADSNFVYTEDPYSVWDQLIAKTFHSNRLHSTQCDHPDWN